MDISKYTFLMDTGIGPREKLEIRDDANCRDDRFPTNDVSGGSAVWLVERTQVEFGDLAGRRIKVPLLKNND